MKTLIFCLLFHSSYVFAQEALPEIVPVKVADVRCGYGWIKCDKDGQPVGAKVDPNIDINKLKADVKSQFGDEALKDFEARQSHYEAFCLSDVLGVQTEASEETHKIITNYLISGDKIIDVCSQSGTASTSAANESKITAKAKGETTEKKEVEVDQKIVKEPIEPEETEQAAPAPIVVTKKPATKTCGQYLKDVAKEVIGKNAAFTKSFGTLDCAGREFNLSQVGVGIGEYQLVKDGMKACGFKTLQDWRYTGDNTRKTCGDYAKAIPVKPPALTPNQPVCARGSFGCEEGDSYGAYPMKKPSYRASARDRSLLDQVGKCLGKQIQDSAVEGKPSDFASNWKVYSCGSAYQSNKNSKNTVTYCSVLTFNLDGKLYEIATGDAVKSPGVCK